MFSTRVRLTALFAAWLLTVAVALTLTLWTARNASVYRDVGRIAISQAELAVRIITQAGEGSDAVIVGPGGMEIPQAGRQVRALLGAMPDYLFVLDVRNQPAYQSAAVGRLPAADYTLLREQLALISDNAQAGLIELQGDTTTGAAQQPGERLLMVARNIPGSPGGLARVITATPTRDATRLPREYLIGIFMITPLILIAATWGAYLMLGRTHQQLGQITDEVAAITDGRSLHRRLALSEGGREFEDLVTTLNEMIERLETSFLGLRRFTADASHELKTPLAVLRADVERAMHDGSTQNERMIALEEALHEITRMTDLVESLLTLARADEGRFDIHREAVDLNPLVQEVYETALILGEGAGVSVTLPFTADVEIQGDRTRLRQLFLNLVTNAIKYTPAGGRVDIGLGRHPDNVTFAVRDTGIGIAAADVPYIFERFWRADRVRSRMSERGGFGLGLAISQWIAHAHGGTLTASSRLGRGSLFTVTLPLPNSGMDHAGDGEGLTQA